MRALDPSLMSHGWDALRRGFPDALAAVLLPDHLHVIPNSDAVGPCRQRLAGVLSGVTRHSRWGSQDRWLEWRLAPARSLASNRDHLARDIRYLALNPCRAGLVADPLEWLWTTHRDVVGAAADPWVTAGRLAAALGRPSAGFARAHHAYVSADPAVRVDGTPLPRPTTPSAAAVVGLERLCAASLAATRSLAAALCHRTLARHVLVRLAHRYGWSRPHMLAEICRMSRRAVRAQRAGTLERRVLEAAELCLGDDRLLRATAREAARACSGLERRCPPVAAPPVRLVGRAPPAAVTGTARTRACGRR
ncbi:MAG: hypothetical protein HY906_18800 [Deltaproteobacteria bacterium]|nr:hypothetical protein [Deltaproteobacteria bacterium]